MDKQPGVTARRTESLTVLSISPLTEDHASLETIVGRSAWTLLTADRVSRALPLLRANEVSVVVCERDLLPGSWKDMLEQIQPMSIAPTLIVTSRLADERLWAEALNLGAWDVIAKPFVRTDVIRSVKLAWEHWRHQTAAAARPMKVMGAAS